MKGKTCNLYSYIVITAITLIGIFMYLYSNHQKVRRDASLFQRKFTQTMIYDYICSKIISNKNRQNRPEHTGLKNAIGYTRIDSTHSYVVLVRPDSFPFYSAGVYLFDQKKKIIFQDSCLYKLNMPDPYKNLSERTMAYDCTFSVSPKQMVLSFMHFSDIIVLDLKGKELCRLKTLEKVASPSIIKYKNCYLFERGKTFNANIAAFLYQNSLYVFSLKTSLQLTQYIVDCYDVDLGKYNYSFYINNAVNEGNMNIRNVFVSNDTITIESSKCVTKIKMR